MQSFTFPLLILTVYWDRFFRVQSQKPNDDFQTEDLRDNLALPKNKHATTIKYDYFSSCGRLEVK
ncbi:hypothetical protein T4E_3921 [Trichinella pseudospiralis]|uniref:Uncharacterized protein n=1 Tax=Trichinella pseudospiralis TaxID=6337 RepID=A0A0V0Y9W1_TRIPS|nr:hypothetical protein T4E_3921 [Trichinella pseudospiralis]